MKTNFLRLSFFFFVLPLCPLCLCGLSFAALDPERDKPYQLHVVLHVAENRFLTPLFKDQLEREVKDQLQLTFGPLAHVQVSRSHPLLRDVLGVGLQQALDGWESLSNRQTHFVLLDFVDGYYELQARLHDGMTGLCSPLIRRERTTDRRLVARTAARLIEQDFGLVGTVVEAGAEVKLAIKGGGLGVPLGRWLQPGEIFVISRLTQEGDFQRATRLQWAVLEVLAETPDGYCRCRLWHRFQEDRLQPAEGVLGYRCLKWATTQAAVRLQFLDPQGNKPLDGLGVQVRGSAKGSKVRELSTNADGLASTGEAFAHLALVRVFSGDQVRAQFPVAIVDDRTVVCRLQIDATTEAQTALEMRKDLWLRRLYDNQRIAVERVGELNQQLGHSLEAARDAARAAQMNLSAELTHLTVERDHLQRQAADRKVHLDLNEGQLRLVELRDKQAELDRFLARLEAVIQEAGSEQAKAQVKMLERARLWETEADFEQAIKLYEQFLAADPEQPQIRAHLAKLKAAWAVHSPEHAQARAFLYQTWPRVEVTSLKTELPKARAAFAVCCQAKDTLTPLKLLQSNAAHAAALKKRLETLRRQDSEDNRNEARAIAEVANGLRRLHAEASGFVKKK